jgi:hypothetical protein
MKTIQIRVRGDTVRHIYHDGLLALANQGRAVTTRASHVEPCAEGGWMVDLSPVGGPNLGPYPRRDEALDIEVEWLNAHGIPTPKSGN